MTGILGVRRAASKHQDARGHWVLLRAQKWPHDRPLLGISKHAADHEGDTQGAARHVRLLRPTWMPALLLWVRRHDRRSVGSPLGPAEHHRILKHVERPHHQKWSRPERNDPTPFSYGTCADHPGAAEDVIAATLVQLVDGRERAVRGHVAAVSSQWRSGTVGRAGILRV